jgi:hypothetical protein
LLAQLKNVPDSGRVDCAVLVYTTQWKQNSEAPMNQSAEEAAIKELFFKRDAAWNAHDATGWSSFFAVDGHFTSWRGHRVQGRENIRVFREQLFA